MGFRVSSQSSCYLWGTQGSCAAIMPPAIFEHGPGTEEGGFCLNARKGVFPKFLQCWCQAILTRFIGWTHPIPVDCVESGKHSHLKQGHGQQSACDWGERTVPQRVSTQGYDRQKVGVHCASRCTIVWTMWEDTDGRRKYDGKTGCRMPQSRPQPGCDLVLEKVDCLAEVGTESTTCETGSWPRESLSSARWVSRGEFPAGKVGNE